jgi:hypothetical protein
MQNYSDTSNCSQDRIRTCMVNFERISLYFLFHLLCLASTIPPPDYIKISATIQRPTWLRCLREDVSFLMWIHVLYNRHLFCSQDRVRTCNLPESCNAPKAASSIPPPDYIKKKSFLHVHRGCGFD